MKNAVAQTNDEGPRTKDGADAPWLDNPPSKSYLLRLWREPESAPQSATLIAVSQPDAQRHFATREALFAYLHAQDGPALDQQKPADSL